MARTSANPKKFIISCRVSNEEMETLRELSEETGLSITMLVRKSLDIMTQNSGHLAQA